MDDIAKISIKETDLKLTPSMAAKINEKYAPYFLNGEIVRKLL